jgi:hypothetical protein
MGHRRKIRVEVKPTSAPSRSEPWLYAFICVHAGREDDPILYVARDAPIDQGDSGWCFGCGRESHEQSDWLLVRASRYFEQDPSLNDLLEMPEGHAAERPRPGAAWSIYPLPPELL